jgi:hypothetical protein
MRTLFKIRLYRERPGDLSIEDVGSPLHPLENPVAVARRRLRIFASALRDREKPLKADVVRDDGTVCEQLSAED